MIKGQNSRNVDFPPSPDASPEPSIGPLRSRAQRHMQFPAHGPMTTRFMEVDPDIIPNRPWRENEFTGGPKILVNDDNGNLRPINDHDYHKRPMTASDTRESEEASSVHRVDDLGFSVVAAAFDFESIKAEAISALKETREKRHNLSSSVQSLETACFESKLREKFEKELRVSKPTTGEYLPLDAFETLFNSRSIILLLEERFPDASDRDLLQKFQDIINTPEKTRTRILGILVAMEGLRHLEEFIQGDIWDSDLPFRESREYTQKSSLLKRWSRNERLVFYENQKAFFVPFFDIKENRLCSYELDRETRLPWISVESKSSGGTGLVHQLEIHPSHHNFSKPGSTANPKFALKEIDASEQQAYRKELTALEKTCAHVQKEKHLIKLLLTFQHGKTFYLLFEWADGNLQEFWDLNSSIQITKATELWAAQQCLGLAKAISRIHGLSSWHDQERKRKRKRSNSIESQKEDAAEWGRHGDIKPANILWFEDYGDCRKHLVISDLGLARYHTEFSKSLVPRALLDGITWGYRAPEIDFGSPISPKYDIFSLGCVFLEFCIWYLRGSEEVAIFGLQRDDEDEPELDDVRKDQFFSITSGCNSITGACLKQCVQERLAQMKTGTNFTKGLASVIENRMLRCNPSERSRIDLIRIDLQNLVTALTKLSAAQEISQDLAFVGSEDPAFSTPLDTDSTLRRYSSHLTFDSPEETSSVEGRDTTGARSPHSEHSRPVSSEHNYNHSDYDEMPIETISTVPEPVMKSKVLPAIVQEVSITSSLQSIVEAQATQNLAEPQTKLEQSIDVGGDTVERNRHVSTTRFRHVRNRSKQWVRETWGDVKGVWK